MKRETGSLAAFVFFLATAPLLFSQNQAGKPSPTLPSEILGPQLIAWSQVQKPQPVSQSDQAAQPSQNQAQEPTQQEPTAQTLTGTVIKDGGRYFLKVSNGVVYQLDDQDRAQKYENKQVKVAGTLDAKGNSFHVTSIELIS
jgi:glucan-binding YG repeat protein